jgi:hypothetical protein
MQLKYYSTPSAGKEYWAETTAVLGFLSTSGMGIALSTTQHCSRDFERKGRSISHPDVWVQQIQSLIQTFLRSVTLDQPPILYIATDTPSMVTRFRQQFASINISVFDLPQHGRREEGAGVLFGESESFLGGSSEGEVSYSFIGFGCEQALF